MDYLKSQPFFYTLTPPRLGEQPVDEFLFDTREGFCEHYASAFTLMMRAAGLPARIVTGYQGGELNGVGGYYIIRSPTHTRGPRGIRSRAEVGFASTRSPRSRPSGLRSARGAARSRASACRAAHSAGSNGCAARCSFGMRPPPIGTSG